MSRITIAAVLLAAAATVGCEKTEDGDIIVETPEIETSTETDTVDLPDVDVDVGTDTVTVPDVDVDVE